MKSLENYLVNTYSTKVVLKAGWNYQQNVQMIEKTWKFILKKNRKN